MKLSDIADNAGSRKKRMRVGRGIGSGKGKTSGRGGKGQTARSGVRIKGFEGGQMPLHRRLPERGFPNLFQVEFAGVNLDRLQEAIDAKLVDVKETVTAESLVKTGVLRRAKDGLRLLGRGEIKAKLNIEVHGASKSAVAAVEKAGGTVKILAPAKTEEGEAAKHLRHRPPFAGDPRRERWTYQSRAPNNVRRLPIAPLGGDGPRGGGRKLKHGLSSRTTCRKPQ